jgi:hypothetical protein
MVLFILFFISLCFAILADIFFVRSERDGYYFMSGVLILAYACLKAFSTLLDAETNTEILKGLVMAAIPLMVWALPLMVKLPWMRRVTRSDEV